MSIETVDVVDNDVVFIKDIDDDGRVRKNYANMEELVESIKEFDLIQPIVLQRADRPLLVVGGRRLAALRRIKRTALIHGKDFIWRDEDLSNPSGIVRIRAMELEENLRRSDLHWSEIIIGKAKLLGLMQAAHGASKGFAAGKTNMDSRGFGVTRLAQMLGEAASTTSRDLELAGYVEKHPILAKMPTKADAQRKLGVAVTVAAMQNIVKKTAVAVSPSVSTISENGQTVGADASGASYTESCLASAPALLPKANWRLYHGRFQDSIRQVADESVDLVLTDMPYLIGLGNSTAAHSAGLGQFEDDEEIDSTLLCKDVAIESFRTLRIDRFAVFFFGFGYYQKLFDALTQVGFDVDVYPLIWVRDRTAPPDGFARFSKSYDPALIARKGNARFIRPNQANVVTIPSVRGLERLHAAQKPVELMTKLILDTTTIGCTVLDMFAGAGTTGVAALENKRRVILFEKEKANCVLIEGRLALSSVSGTK